MKNLTKGKKGLLFGVAAGVCAAALIFQAVSPFASAVSELTAFADEVQEAAIDGVPNGQKGYTVTGGVAPVAEEITGWNFQGWYSAPLEYYFWGDKELTYGTIEDMTIPPEDWKCALEFEEGGPVVDDPEIYSEEMLKYKEYYYRWLTRTTGEAVAEFRDGDVVYPRYKPQKVEITYVADKPEGYVEKRQDLPGVYYGTGILTSYRQYGSPLGSLWNDIGDRAYGRVLTGWRSSTSLDKIPTVEAKGGEWWSDQKLDETFLKHESGKWYTIEFQWKITIKAMFEGETYTVEQDGEIVGQSEVLVDEPQEEEDDFGPGHICKPCKIILENATCTTPGIRFHYQCKCGRNFQNPDCTIELSDEELVVPPHHTPVKISGKSATCTASGTKAYYVCSGCYEKFADAECTQKISAPETIPATGHRFGSGYAVSDAAGHYHTCTVCGIRDAGEAHKWNVSEATTETAKVCTECGYVGQAKKPLPQHVHHGVYVAGSAATCTESGRKGYYACDCGKIFEDANCTHATSLSALTIPAKGHHGVKTEKVSATCTEDGREAYYTCSDCGKIFSDKNCKHETEFGALVIPAKGHHTAETGRVDASCTENGTDTYYYCVDCGQLFRDRDAKQPIDRNALELPALGHAGVETAAVAPTCTEDGREAFYTCAVCGKIFRDADCTIETEESALVIPAKGHSGYTVEAKEATCTENGNPAYFHCDVCGKDFTDQSGTAEAGTTVIPAKGHSGYTVAAKEATCTENGNPAYFHCDVCGKDFTDQSGTAEVGTTMIPAKGHSGYTVAAKKATCTENGNPAYFHCTVCGKDFTDQSGAAEAETTVTPAKGHTWSAYGTEYADEAEHYQVCTVCGAHGNAHAHEFNLDEATEQEAKYCKTCGYVAEERKEPTPPAAEPETEQPQEAERQPEIAQQPEIEQPEVEDLPEAEEQPEIGNEPEVVEPVEPEVVEPVEPEVVEPEIVEPVESEVVEPVESEVVEPEVIEPVEKVEENVVENAEEEAVESVVAPAQPEKGTLEDVSAKQVIGSVAEELGTAESGNPALLVIAIVSAVIVGCGAAAIVIAAVKRRR